MNARAPNWRRGMFRAWLLLWIVWVAFVAAIATPWESVAGLMTERAPNPHERPVLPEGVPPLPDGFVLDGPWLKYQQAQAVELATYRRDLAQAAAIGLLPPLALLLAGLGVGWVLVGFRRE